MSKKIKAVDPGFTRKELVKMREIEHKMFEYRATDEEIAYYNTLKQRYIDANPLIFLPTSFTRIKWNLSLAWVAFAHKVIGEKFDKDDYLPPWEWAKKRLVLSKYVGYGFEYIKRDLRGSSNSL